MGKKTLEEISPVFVRPINSEEEEKFSALLFDNNIPHDCFYSPNGEIYEIPREVYEVLTQQGINLRIVEVKNIGSLSLEERNKIKRYHLRKLEEDREKTLEEFFKKYGNL
ncbi:MAG: hypothetical protein ABH804_02070 [archaeon]